MKWIHARLFFYIVQYLLFKIVHSRVGQTDSRLPQSILARNVCYKCKTTFINKITGETTCPEYMESCCPGYEGRNCDVSCFDCRKFQQLEKRYELIYYKIKNFQDVLLKKNESDHEGSGNIGNDTDASHSACNCPTGTPGERGPVGLQGPRGPPGPPGLSAPTRKIDANESGENCPSCATNDTGLLLKVSALQCPPGPEGPQGPQGPPGPKGSQGEQGRDGMPGPKGELGDIGEPGRPGNTGPKGSQGEKGEAGPKGDMGLKGTEGKAGPKGSDGPQGLPGLPGIMGVESDAFKHLEDELRNLSQEFSLYKIKVLELEEFMAELKSRTKNSTASPPLSLISSRLHAFNNTDRDLTIMDYPMDTPEDTKVSNVNIGIARSTFLTDFLTQSRKQTTTWKLGCCDCKENFERYRVMVLEEGFQEPHPLAPLGTQLRAKQCRILKRIMRRI